MSLSEAAPGDVAWRISSKCDSGACVGVARQDEFVIVGNTSKPGSPVSRFTVEEWGAFLGRVKHGDFGKHA
jgi:hypothetical protein